MASSRAEAKIRTCRSCFYQRRCDPHLVTVLQRGQRCRRCGRYGAIQVILREQIYETTFVRKRGNSSDWPMKCDPKKLPCTGDECPYAHGTEELESWQKQFLKENAKRGSQSNKAQGDHHNGRPQKAVSDQSDQDRQAKQSIAQQSPHRIKDSVDRKEFVDVHVSISNGTTSKNKDHPQGISNQAAPELVPHMTQSDLTCPLTSVNYKMKFHYLLHLEEKEHISLLETRCNGKEYDIVFVKSGNSGNEEFISYISTSSSESDILSFAKQASKSCTIDIGRTRLNVEHNNQVFKLPHFIQANVNFIVFDHTSDDRKSLGIADTDTQKHLKGKVTFKPDGTYFYRIHKAVDLISEEGLCKIIPSEPQFHCNEHNSVRISVGNQHSLNLDEEQKRACIKALTSSSTIPFLILGPFGTGKTRVLAKLAHEIVCHGSRRMKPKVLLVAHHQTSADTLANLFLQLNDPSVTVVRIFKTNEKSKRKGYVTYSPINEIEDINCLNQFDVVITTLGTSYFLRHKIPKRYRIGYFTHILIDEGAQTREPEAIIPLCFAGNSTKIVIAGDHCQVGPRLQVLGEDPQKYGLAISLLERLHSTYAEYQPQSEAYTTSLIVNYRCVPEIVRFSSHLYYESSLHCHLQSRRTKWHPIQFICSSVENTDNSIDNSIEEANIVIDAVRKYKMFKPEELACIICSSSTQALLLRKMLRKKNIHGVEVVKTYDVQGREFEAVFISTCEEIADGSAVNHTKSLSSHYVFNTVITRSRFVIVAVGNPYLLIKTEENMMKKFPKSSKQCWTPFLRKCYDTEQFKISNLLQDIEDNYKSLSRFLSTSLFSESLKLSRNVEANDTILNSYTKSYEYDNEFTKISQYFSKQVQKVYNSLDKNETEYEECLDCKFDADTFYSATAIPLDSKKSDILIEGRQNRIGAFNGDIVTVGVFPSFIPGKRYGRVIKVVERVKNLTFVCEVSPDNSDSFYPVDGKNSTFRNFPNSTNNIRRNQTNLKKHNRRHGCVYVYNCSTMTEKNLPKVEDIIEYERALNMAFVIKFVSWNPKYITPFGVVIKAFHKAYNSISAECLLSIVHSVSLESDLTECTANHSSSDHSNKDLIDMVDYPCAFTIDPDDARNLDDAITLSKISEYVYKLGVHITDVSETVILDSAEDKMAFSKGTAVYYKRCGELKMIPMLSNNTLENLSLTPGNVRTVWSTTCDIHFHSDGSVRKTENVDIRQSQLRSVLQLTYEQAQNVLNGSWSPDLSNDFNSLSSIPLKKTLDILYSIALHFSKIRLKSDDAMYWYGDGTGDMADWQAHKLVEELMVWTNSEVAKKLRVYPEGALLRCQPQPDDRDMEIFRKGIANVSEMSFNLSRYNNKLTSLNKFLVPRDVFETLKMEKLRGSGIKVAGMIMSDSLFPQLFAASSKKKKIFQRAKYCIVEQDVPERSHCHFSLGVSAYTHFTSPLRRYFDIAVQRLLKGGFAYQAAIDEKFCSSMNTCLSLASGFEKNMKSVELALSVQYCSRLCLTCIESNAKSTITFGILCNELASLSSKYTKIRTASLGPFMLKRSSQHSRYCWNVKITSLSGEKYCGAKVSRLDFLNESRCTSFIQTYQTDRERLTKVNFKILFRDNCIPVSSQQWKIALEFTKNFFDTISDQTLGDLSEIRYSTTPIYQLHIFTASTRK